MKSVKTPHTKTGRTDRALDLVVGPSKIPVSVPADTACEYLPGGTGVWVVSDLRFLPKDNFLYPDADTYGIRVLEENIIDVKDVIPVPAY